MSVQSSVAFITERYNLQSILVGIALRVMVRLRRFPTTVAGDSIDAREYSRFNCGCYSLVRRFALWVISSPSTNQGRAFVLVFVLIPAFVAIPVIVFSAPPIFSELSALLVPARLALCMASIGAALVFSKVTQGLNQTALRAPLHVSHGVDLQRKTHLLRQLHKSPNHAVAPQVGRTSVTDMRFLSNYLHGLASPSIPRIRLMFNCPKWRGSRWN